MTTPIEAIIAPNAPQGEPIFNEFEANCVLKRLAAAGFVVVPKEPTEDMLQAGSMNPAVQLLQGLMALGIANSKRADSVIAQAYKGMIEQAEGK